MPIKIASLLLFCLPLFAPLSFGQEIPANLKALHVLNRLGFGPRPGDIEKVNAMGIDAYIKQQLSPDSIGEPPSLTDKLNAMSTLHMRPPELFDQYGDKPKVKGQRLSPEEVKSIHKKGQIIINETSEARLLRAIESPKQLQEVMVDFWFNHFNVYSRKNLDRIWTGAYENQAIRPFALGRFRDLLGATAHHPAMLEYLDNSKNIAPGTGAKDHRGNQGINENYARELMELHTLGVNGGYSQDDVIALAHILTGWGFRNTFKDADDFGFYFNSRHHDFSDKQFLGHTIKGRGPQEVEEALDILAKSPATARHICYQLAEYFVADTPDDALVSTLAAKFMDSDGNIQEVLNTLFHSSQFWDQKNFNNKFKTPYQYVISSLRATGEPVTNFKHIIGALRILGMPLYDCLTPDGYKHTQDAWLNSDSMNQRINFVTQLVIRGGHLKINDNFQPIDPSVLMATLGNYFSDQTRQAVSKASPGLQSALILGSPEFMRY
jgi:uncharacterized protein (DUF1800 family)